MSIPRGPDWYGTVRAHWTKTKGFLLASSEACITIRNNELVAVGNNRSMASRDPTNLIEWVPGASWILGVLLCPGDSVLPVLDWLRRHRADPSRVWFYLHPKADLEVLRPWYDAGFPTDQVDVVSTWERVHKLFGLALNDQVYADWKNAA